MPTCASTPIRPGSAESSTGTLCSIRPTGLATAVVYTNDESPELVRHEGLELIRAAKIAGAAVLVTGANRGLGRALAEKPLRRGAKRVCAATRKLFAHSDAHGTPFASEATNDSQISRQPASAYRIQPPSRLLAQGGMNKMGLDARSAGCLLHRHSNRQSHCAKVDW